MALEGSKPIMVPGGASGTRTALSEALAEKGAEPVILASRAPE